ncbi:hypothetical protein CLOM_g20232 [Closterium sp. NIES-68]|nr:hypothetical protein CLOM_g20232 [Closterium sp. NIES-68]
MDPKQDGMDPKQGDAVKESSDPVIVSKDMECHDHVLVLKHVPATVSQETLDRLLQRLGATEVITRSKGVVYARFKEQNAAVTAKKQLHGIRMGSSNVLSAHYFPPSLPANQTEPHTKPINPAAPAPAAAAAAANPAAARATQQHEPHTEPSPPLQSPPPSSHQPLTDPSLHRLVHALLAFSEQEQLIPRNEGAAGQVAFEKSLKAPTPPRNEGAAGRERLVGRESARELGREEGMGGGQEAARQQQRSGAGGKDRGKDRGRARGDETSHEAPSRMQGCWQKGRAVQKEGRGRAVWKKGAVIRFLPHSLDMPIHLPLPPSSST